MPVAQNLRAAKQGGLAQSLNSGLYARPELDIKTSTRILKSNNERVAREMNRIAEPALMRQPACSGVTVSP
jgi:hypothetical protein